MTMQAQKRSRACEACHVLKIKCDMANASKAGGDHNSRSAGCTRCQKMGIDCVPAPPRLQRDRIADLEAQVEALTLALQERDRSNPPASNAQPASGDSASTVNGHAALINILAFIDAHTSKDEQSRALDAYSHGFKAVWCPANLSSQSLEDVRNNSPLLLLTIVAFPMAAEACGNSSARANELTRGAVEVLTRRVLVEGDQNQDLVRALLTAAFWHRVPRGEVAGHCHQYSRLAIDMAIDIGLGGREFPGSPAVYFRRMDGHTDNDSGRTWLACYAAGCMNAINERRPAMVGWSKQHETSLRIVENNGRFEDRLFCQIILLIRLCEQVAKGLELCDFTAFHDINSASCQQKMAMLTDQFQKWKDSVSQELLGHPMVRFWSCIFVILLHEVVLHTPTNKTFFVAPHVPPGLSVTDFPAPLVVTDIAATAMSNLITACHGAILACEDMSPEEVLAAPSMIFPPAVMYALKALVQVFITLHGPESTLGASPMISKEAICMRQYIDKVMAISKAVESITYIDSYWTGRILGASSWLNTWANDYEVILERYVENQRTGKT